MHAQSGIVLKNARMASKELHGFSIPSHFLADTTLNLKTFDYPLTTSNAFDHICRQQTYGFA